LTTEVFLLNDKDLSLQRLHKNKKSFNIVKPKATCYITRQTSINARASVRYPIQTVKQAELFAGDKASISNLRFHLWLVRAWVRMPFAAIFADIPEDDLSLAKTGADKDQA